ncbi:MAG: ATPase, partial [Rhodospirillales bacterium]|nr:ATPase [Rhodospirillales bacterium]
MWTPKRFYKSAETGVSQDGYTILLDGRSVKTPAGAVLAVPTQALAQAIASEWDAQEDEIQPETMPAHQLAVSAIDGVRTNRRAIIAGILAFADTDLLCYRAVTPDDLVERQNSVWQPLLDWVQQNTSVPFVVTQGVMPVDQPPAVVTELRKTVEALDEFEIAVLSSVTAAAGSIV